MNIFKKRETLIENMTFMAIMAAINIAISIISTLLGMIVPIVSVIFIIVLPLTSTIVTLFCKNKYYPIYAFSSIGLSLVATMWNMQYTIFYLVPSIFTGFIFGLLLKKRVHGIYSIAIAGMVQTAITCALIPLINVIYSVNFIDDAKTLFNITPESFLNNLVLAFILLVSFVQVGLSYLVVKEEVKKFNIDSPLAIEKTWLLPVISLIFITISIPFVFTYFSGVFVAFLLSIYFTIASLIIIIPRKLYASLIAIGIATVASIILFAIIYPVIDNEKSSLLIELFPLCNNIGMIIVSCLIKK